MDHDYRARTLQRLSHLVKDADIRLSHLADMQEHFASEPPKPEFRRAVRALEQRLQDLRREYFALLRMGGDEAPEGMPDVENAMAAGQLVPGGSERPAG